MDHQLCGSSPAGVVQCAPTPPEHPSKLIRVWKILRLLLAERVRYGTVLVVFTFCHENAVALQKSLRWMDTMGEMVR